MTHHEPASCQQEACQHLSPASGDRGCSAVAKMLLLLLLLPTRLLKGVGHITAGPLLVQEGLRHVSDLRVRGRERSSGASAVFVFL